MCNVQYRQKCRYRTATPSAKVAYPSRKNNERTGASAPAPPSLPHGKAGKKPAGVRGRQPPSFGYPGRSTTAVSARYKKKRPASGWEAGRKKKVRAALLSHALERTIIAAGGLNGRVRDGNGCFTPANGTNQKDRQPAERKDVSSVPWNRWTSVVDWSFLLRPPEGFP